MLQLRTPIHPSPSPLMKAPDSQPTTAETANPAQRQIHQMLSRYITTIRRPDFLPRLNKMLQLRAVSTMGFGGASANIKAYYANRPELRTYTLGVELDRDLEYTLIHKDGRSVTDKEAIRSHFGYDARRSNAKMDSQLLKCDGGLAVDTDELLLRAANQSLLADALVSLTGSEEVLLPAPAQAKRQLRPGLVLSGPALSMTSVVERCHFTIDLEQGQVQAICVLAVSVPDEDRRLVLARAILIANFRPGAEGRQSQLQYAMQLVKAHHCPESLTLRDASISLARDQANLMFQEGSEDDDSSQESNEAGQRQAGRRRPFFMFGRSA